jgi:hypothetical protein
LRAGAGRASPAQGKVAASIGDAIIKDHLKDGGFLEKAQFDPASKS